MWLASRDDCANRLSCWPCSCEFLWAVQGSKASVIEKSIDRNRRMTTFAAYRVHIAFVKVSQSDEIRITHPFYCHMDGEGGLYIGVINQTNYCAFLLYLSLSKSIALKPTNRLYDSNVKVIICRSKNITDLMYCMKPSWRAAWMELNFRNCEPLSC